jgi:hypothetical protein
MPLDQKKEELQAKRMARLPKGFGIEWATLRTFRIGSVKFRLAQNLGEHAVPGNDGFEEEDVFYLCKKPGLIQKYLTFVNERPPKNIVELGILRGGSVAFLQLLANPEKFLALELASDRVPILDRFIDNHGLSKSLRVEYGINQADSGRVRELVQEHFGGGRNIDVVIDDASHLLDATRSSFETLFPLIRPGGSYIVEDYSAVHTLFSSDIEIFKKLEAFASDTFTKLVKHSLQEDKKPVHLLAVEAMLASILVPDIIKKVVVDNQWLRIVRGPKEIDLDKPFDIRILAADKFGLLETKPDDSLREYLDW